MGEDGSDRGVRKIQRLHAAANWMRVKLMDLGLAVEGDWDSPVIPVMLINSAKIASFSRILLERNIAAVVVGFPATALLKGRVRLCISAGHSLSDMQYALECIKVRSSEPCRGSHCIWARCAHGLEVASRGPTC